MPTGPRRGLWNGQILCSGVVPPGLIAMSDWKVLMNEAMQLEGRDTIAAFAKFRECIDAAMSSTQSSLKQKPDDGEAMEYV